MKLIKLIGLAAVAAIAATAFIGVSSAAAQETVLCTANELACQTGNKVELTLVHAEATNPELKTNLGTVKCASALLSAEVLMLGSPYLGHIHELTYTTCKIGLTSCGTVETTHLGLLDLLKTATNLGELNDLALNGAFTTIHMVCGGIIDCQYKWKNLTGHALGQEGTELAKVTYTEAEVTKVGGALCPATSKLTAVFKDLMDGLFISN